MPTNKMSAGGKVQIEAPAQGYTIYLWLKLLQEPLSIANLMYEPLQTWQRGLC